MFRLTAPSAIFVEIKTERQKKIKSSINLRLLLLLTCTEKLLNVKILTAEDTWILTLIYKCPVL